MLAFENCTPTRSNEIKLRLSAERGTVTLRGRVRSWTEWGAATRAAWSVPGVAAVDNELSISDMEMSA